MSFWSLKSSTQQQLSTLFPKATQKTNLLVFFPLVLHFLTVDITNFQLLWCQCELVCSWKIFEPGCKGRDQSYWRQYNSAKVILLQILLWSTNLQWQTSTIFPRSGSCSWSGVSRGWAGRTVGWETFWGSLPCRGASATELTSPPCEQQNPTTSPTQGSV